MILEPRFIPKLGLSFWPKLYAFYYVAQLQSYSRAAESLSLSQSSVSRAVQALESRLKTVLLLRKRGGSIALTEQGQKIFKHLKGMVTDLGCLELSLDSASLKAESLSLKISNGLLSDYCIDAILSFKQGLPKLRLQIYADTDPNNTLNARFDIQIGGGFIPHKAMVQKPLFRLSLGYYASQRYLNTHEEPKDLKDLSKHRIYQYSQTATFFQTSKPVAKLQPIFEAIQPYSSIDSSACLIKMAEADCGIIAFIRDHPALQESGLMPILESYAKTFEERSVYFCCSKAIWERQEVQMLYGFLKLHLKNTLKNQKLFNNA